MKSRLFQSHRDEHGVALILVLAILVLVTLLIFTFAINMRVESAASKTYTEQVKARQFAMAAVDEAVAKLRLATPRISGNPTTILANYFTAPGVIYTITNGMPRTIPLSTTGTVDDVWMDINFGSRGLINRINNANYKIAVPWRNWVTRYVSPSKTVSSNVVGRYCYWVDDEASKININTARMPPASPAPRTYTPEDIDLRAVRSDINTDASYSYAQTRGYYSPDSWWVSGAFVNAAVGYSNAFRVTAYSQDTRLTPWGAPCFNLNTNLITVNPVNYMSGITNMLANANLNLWFGQTFRQKYGDNLMQIAANITDYIDSDNACTDSGGSPPSYLGLEQTPYLNELVISNSLYITTNAVGALVVNRTSVTLLELWYMYPPPAPVYDLSGHSVMIQGRPSISSTDPAFGIQTFGSPVSVSAGGAMTPAPWPGAYEVLTVDSTNVVAQTMAPNVTLDFNMGTVTAVFQGPLGRIDYAEIRMTNHTFTVTRSMVNSTRTLRWISAARDPRVRPVSNFWNPVGGGTTFGLGTLRNFNSGTVYYNLTNTAPGASVLLRSDGGLQGSTPEYSCHTNIANRGTISSVGELAFIHTGVPWRTLALRSQDPVFEMPAGAIPDWAVLDLFCTTNKMDGRININSQIYLSNTVHVLMSRQREHPLRALYYSAFNAGVASNIQHRVWNTLNSYVPPISWPFSTNCYNMIGQVCEVAGVTSNAVTKATAERSVRAIANLITTRSNTFSIWAVGQAIVDVNKDGAFDPADGDSISGEVVVQVIVERYEDPAALPANRVKFRTRYFHYYTN